MQAFLEDIRADRLFAVLMLSLLGLRPAEVWRAALVRRRPRRGHPDRREHPHPRRRRDGREGPKSDKGKRHLPLPAPTAAALKAFRSRQTAERLAAGPAYTDTGYVLVDELGQPWRTHWLRRAAYRLMDQTGVREVRLYDARHACLTYLATSGVPGRRRVGVGWPR